MSNTNPNCWEIRTNYDDPLRLELNGKKLLYGIKGPLCALPVLTFSPLMNGNFQLSMHLYSEENIWRYHTLIISLSGIIDIVQNYCYWPEEFLRKKFSWDGGKPVVREKPKLSLTDLGL